MGMSLMWSEPCVASLILRNEHFSICRQISQGPPPPLGAPFRQTAPPLDAVVQSSPDSSARPPSPLHLVQPRLHNAAQVGVDGPVRSVAATVRWGASRQRRTAPPRGALRDPVRVWVAGLLGRAALHAPDRARRRRGGVRRSDALSDSCRSGRDRLVSLCRTAEKRGPPAPKCTTKKS